MGLSGSLEPNMLTLAAYEERPSVTVTTLVPVAPRHALDGQGNRGARGEHVEAGPQLGHGVHRRAVDLDDDLAGGQVPAGRAGRRRPRPRRRPRRRAGRSR